MRVVLLGSVQVYGDDTSGAYDDHAAAVPVGGVRLRMLLARLALDAGRAVSVDALVDGLWGEEPPADAVGALQALVSRLRKALRGTGALESTAGGYRLAVWPEDVDAFRFEELAARGRRELAAGRFGEAASSLGAALALWQGPALADVLEAPFAGAAAARLEEVRSTAVEDRFDAELRLGRHAEALADLGAAAAARPLSERLAELRMRALWAAGRQSDALATYEEIRQRLSDELGVDPSAELQEIHLTLLRGELERPSASSTSSANRLPARLTSFVGRKAELAQLDGLLTASRLVTIVGPGGAGKTRLSLEAVTRHPAHGRGRVWFVPLGAVGAADQLADAVLGAIGSTDGGLYDAGQTAAPKTAAVDRMAELLDIGDAVLVLDNCEHLVEAAAELADQLLERLPRLTILTSSREPLAITGEVLCHLGPLDLPTGTPEPSVAARADAVRLFVERAAGVRPGFALDDSTVGAVVEICRRLDGLPLALELAAAKLRSMGVDQIARRLDDRFRLLTSGSRTALPRQRTLLAVVEWSWDLLDEPERVLARRLSAFPGGATLAALEAVCADGAAPAPDDVLYVLDSLIEKSLVTAHESDAGEPRYRMLETVRAYAATRLTASGDDIRAPFSAYFLALAQEHEPRLRTGEQLDAIAVFDAEHANLVHALRTAVAAGDAVVASRFVEAMFWYWGVRGMNTQLETALAEVRGLGDAGPGARARRGGADAVVSAGAREFHPAGMLLRVSQLAFPEGEVESAGDAGASLRRSLDSPDPWVRASAHLAYDFVLTEQGDLRTGEPSRLEALRWFEAVGDRWGLVLSLMPVGRDHSLRGEHAAAVATFERAVALSSELGTEDFLYLSKARLARERRRSGDLDGARRDLESALRQAKERSHRRLEANILVGLANLHRRAGDLVQANAVLDQLEDLVRRRAIPVEVAEDLIVSTRMENRLAEGAAAQARELLPRAAAALFAQGAGAGLAWVAELLGGLLALEDDPVGAATALGMSQVIRGAFDEGEPELRELVDRLVGRLGEAGYRAAYGEGAGMPRRDALNRLAEEVGQPVAS
ncbi:BTAD domain-containing putative transcriptional regulator [Streptomyces sp. NPDC048696]|uniref:BTAD domain-containing putative transcriptional regulator n=1 Tax=Streptomyces sp. NPDC048696 TaxID=3365585 RepID=UPI0037136974